jgi:hypothetical protein
MYSALEFFPILMYIDFFSTDFWKNPQIPNFIKIRPVWAGLFHAERQTDERTDMTQLTVAFRNFAKAPKNSVAV